MMKKIDELDIIDISYLYDITQCRKIFRKQITQSSSYLSYFIKMPSLFSNRYEAQRFQSTIEIYDNNQNKENTIFSFSIFFENESILNKYIEKQLKKENSKIEIINNQENNNNKYTHLDFLIEIENNILCKIEKQYIRALLCFHDNPSYFIENHIDFSNFDEDQFNLFYISQF